MDPNITVFIQALRNGKSSGAAFMEYCWAKMAVQIESREAALVRRGASVRGQGQVGSPLESPPVWGVSMAEAMGAEAFDEGRKDEEIEAAFVAGLKLDRERGYLWRAMSKEERPTSGDLLWAMGLDDRIKAGEIFGYGRVARAMVAR